MRKLILILLLLFVGCANETQAKKESDASLLDILRGIGKAVDAGFAGADSDYARNRLYQAQGDWYQSLAEREPTEEEFQTHGLIQQDMLLIEQHQMTEEVRRMNQQLEELRRWQNWQDYCDTYNIKRPFLR